MGLSRAAQNCQGGEDATKKMPNCYRIEWACLLAYITGPVDQELLLRNEYLAAENHILRAQIKGWLLQVSRRHYQGTPTLTELS